ncbi:hypothetical protein [Lacimonas salitolerans]|uniref:Uncharacterized protein n=1 Tax=Lacimonas salitolerans TaxID=1323750 RepID=A0ABW4EE67_9RHOB
MKHLLILSAARQNLTGFGDFLAIDNPGARSSALQRLKSRQQRSGLKTFRFTLIYARGCGPLVTDAI